MVATTVTVVGLSSSFFGSSVHAEPIGALQNKQTQVKSERATVKENLTKAEAEIADVLIDLKEINEELVRVEEALKENQKVMEQTEADIANIETEITDLEAEIEELEARIEIRYNKLKERMASYQKSGGEIGYLEVLFGSKSFGEFISRVSAVTKITNADADLARLIEEDKEKVEEKKVELEEKLAELHEQKVELEGMAQLIHEQKEQHEASKKKLESKEQELKELKSELQSKDSNLAALEAQIRRDIEIARNPVAVTTTNNMGGNNAPAATNNSVSQPVANAPVAAGKNINVAINAGYPHLGTPYRWAGKGPSGFDCSGFVSWAFAQAGYSIPSSTAGLQHTGTQVSYSNIQAGDIVFFDTYKKNGHVGIYIGGGQFIGSQNSTGLAVASMNSTYWRDRKSVV